jgi:hypothetical protein
VDEHSDRVPGLVGRMERRYVEARAACGLLPHGDEALSRSDEADLLMRRHVFERDDRDEDAEDVRAVVLDERPLHAFSHDGRRESLEYVGIDTRRKHSFDLTAGRIDEVEPTRAHRPRG